MNPLKNNMSTPDHLDNLMRLLENGPNAQQLIQQSLRNNPRAQQAITQLKNMSNGMHPRDFLFQLAQQKGMDTSRIMKIAQKFGLK